MKRAIKDRPYVDNYPPLRDFLRELEARCDWQLPLGDRDDPTAYVEQWRTPSGATMIITVQFKRFGWDIATPCGSRDIGATLADAKERLGRQLGRDVE